MGQQNEERADAGPGKTNKRRPSVRLVLGHASSVRTGRAEDSSVKLRRARGDANQTSPIDASERTALVCRKCAWVRLWHNGNGRAK